MKKTVLATLMAAAASHVSANEEKPLTADIEVGIIATSGNTETESYKGAVNVKQNLERWRNTYIFEALLNKGEVERTDTDGETVEEVRTTAERYFASAKGDYKIGREHAAFFVYGEYDRDRFSGFDYQYTIAVGYTDRFFTTDNSYLSYDIGPGYTVNQPEEFFNPVPAPGQFEQPDEESSAIIRAALEYLYEFSENAKFTQTVSSNISPDSDENTKTKAVSAITASINSAFKLRASYTINHNSEVPADRESTDTEIAVTGVYSF